MKISGKILSAAAAAMMFLSSVPSANAADNTAYIHGDMNYDSNLNILDCILMKSFILERTDSTELAFRTADINEDGSTDAFDLIILQNYIFGTVYPMTEFEIIPEKNYNLIPSSVANANSSAQSLGTAESLNFFVEFNDAEFAADRLSEDELREEFFGKGKTTYPFESISEYLTRSSYGNFTVSGDVVYCRLNASISDYSTKPADRERLVMDIMKSLDDRIDYSQFDADKDGDIDILTVTLPLDKANDDIKSFWYGATHTWYYNPYFMADGVRIGKFIGNDVMPYWKSMYYFKQTYLHELGHCMGLSDYYKYASSDYEGLKGNAGYCRMDDSIGDYCTFSKLMLGWLRENEVQIYDREQGGLQSFTLSDAGTSGSCLIIPAKKWDGTFTSEYFLVEYVSDAGNNMDVKNFFGNMWSRRNNTGFRIMHIDAELFTDYWGRTDFKYDNYSEKYNGDDKERIVRLVSSGYKGFFKAGDRTDSLMSYGSSGYEDVNSGYEVVFTEEADGKYSLTVQMVSD